jgi:hypothetical protein
MSKTIRLSQSQLDELVLRENEKAVLCEAFMGLDFNEALKKGRELIKKGVAVGAVIAALVGTYSLDDAQKEKISKFFNVNSTNTNDMTDNGEQKTFDQQKFNDQVAAVDQYMKSVVALNGYNPNDIQLTPLEIVKKCYEHNFKISNLLAHLHQESCFGMTPRARKSNSPFSVMLYDNPKKPDGKIYNSQDDSIEGFLNLIEKDYLRNGKTYSDLISGKNSFINYQNNRYAQDPNYEAKIQQLTNRVEKNFPILGELQ